MECCLDVKQWCHLPHTGHDRCGEMDTVDKIGNQESDKDRALNKTSTAAGCACGMRTRSTVKMRIEQSLRNSRFGQMGYSVHFDDGLVLITFAHVATNTANVEYSRPSCPRWLHMNNMAVNHSGLSCSTMTAVLRIGQWIHCITSTTSALDNLNVSVSYKTEMGACTVYSSGGVLICSTQLNRAQCVEFSVCWPLHSRLTSRLTFFCSMTTKYSSHGKI